MKQRPVLILLIGMINYSLCVGQNSLSVAERHPVKIDMTSLIEAGKNIEMVADDDQWINYTLDMNPSEPAASISVSVASGSIPNGIELYMQAGHYTGPGKGKTGKPTGKIRIDHIPRAIIGDIGTSHTGNGKHQGHQLVLSMVITDFSLLHSGDYTFYLQYTLKQ